MSTISALLPEPPNNFSTTLSANITSSGLTIALNSISGLPTEGIGAIYSKDTSGNIVASSLEFVHWTNTGANAVTLTDTGDRGLSGSANGAQAHNSGDTFEVWVHSKYNAGLRTALANLVNTTTGALDTTKVVDPTTSQTLTNKILSTGSSMAEALLTFTDITTNDVSTSKHGFVPKAPNDTTKFLRGDGSWAVPSSSSDGWTSDSDTWTYVSASSFKISGKDVSSRFPKGTRIKCTNNSTTFYGVVASSTFSTDTTITLIANNDYSLANSAITNPYYSYQASPQGYPGSFSFTTTWGGFSVNPSGYNFFFNVIGNICSVIMDNAGSDGTSNATSLTFTIPVAAKRSTYNFGLAFGKDAGANLTNPVQLQSTAGSTTVSVAKQFYGGAWTNSGTKAVYLQLFSFEF